MRRLVAWSALFIISAAAPAIAAPPPIQERHQLRMKPESAECLIRRHSAFVMNWAATIPGTQAEKKLVRPAQAYFTSCFPYWPNAYASTWNLEAIRGRLILELLRPRLADLPDLAPPGLGRAAWYSPEEANEASAAPALLANDLGFCLARSDWSNTRALVRAEEGSSAGRAALQVIVPLVPGCLPPGRKLTLDVPRLRTILIETVYHATR